MIIDFLFAVFVGVSLESATVFVVLILLALPFARRDRPLSSGLFKIALMALGISALMSLFGGSDCDCDL